MITDTQLDAAVDVAMQFLPEFPENLRDMLIAVIEAADAAAWQPIETAPVSPKLPRTWLQFWNGEEVRIGYVEPDEGDCYGTQYVGQDGELIEPRLYGSSQNKPTHWRQLPEPPR